MSRIQNIRPLKSIPVYIEEDHHEVLPHIYKHIGKIKRVRKMLSDNVILFQVPKICQ